jgi:uncharacterized heparinase superfamily protein
VKVSLRAWLYRSALYSLALWGPTPSTLRFRLEEAWPGDASRGQDMLGAPPHWTEANQRFLFLADLKATEGEEGARAAREWTSDWLRRFDRIDDVAWRPDIIGDRLYSWIAFYEFLAGGKGEAALRQALLQSLARQMRHLFRVWKRASGLARLKALRGLVAAAAAVEDKGRLGRACEKLAEECKAQILPDGGHPSRDPSAVLAVLAYLIESRDALAAASAEIPAALLAAIDRAAPLLRFFHHGDGKLALFNGSSESAAGLIALVLQRAESEAKPPLRAPHMGYERLQAGESLVILDCGAQPPRAWDENAHAGALALEMSVGSERLLVNCGARLVGEMSNGERGHGERGEADSWRLAMRATAAHSTLIVADTSSAEIGPDGHFTGPAFVIASKRSEEGGDQYVWASHDGYRASFGLSHSREIYLAADGEDLRGEDRLESAGNDGAGRGFAIRFHLHPEIQASANASGDGVDLRLPGGALWRFKATGAAINLAESVYLGTGVLRRSQQVILSGFAGSDGVSVKWAMRRERGTDAE